MTEEFLHYIWKYRLFDNKNLQTQSGEPIEIIKPGEHNTDAGPDFSTTDLTELQGLSSLLSRFLALRRT